MLPFPRRMSYPPGVSNKEGAVLIRGWGEIAKVLGVAPQTARRWRTLHALPVCNLPSGHVCTTLTLIDHWVAARAAEQAKQRGYG